MASSLVFGFLIGLRHALDIDHVAAILTFAASENASPGRSMALGGIWGIGHATMLLLLGMTTLLFDLQPSANLVSMTSVFTPPLAYISRHPFRKC